MSDVDGNDRATHADCGPDCQGRAIESMLTAITCPHCGSPPDSDGDHSCPCPYRDDECPTHQEAAS